MTTRTEPSEIEAPTSDPAVVAQLVERHRDFLAFLERRLGDRALAEDVLQDAFVRSLDRLGTLRSDESAVAWFYRVLRNAVVDRHRRSASQAKGLVSYASELETHEAPEAETERAICRCVGGLATTLKPEYASAVARVDVDGVSVKDYASEAGITANNAAVRLHRAREALRRRVASTCGTCAEHGCVDCTGGSTRA